MKELISRATWILKKARKRRQMMADANKRHHMEFYGERPACVYEPADYLDGIMVNFQHMTEVVRDEPSYWFVRISQHSKMAMLLFKTARRQPVVKSTDVGFTRRFITWLTS